MPGSSIAKLSILCSLTGIALIYAGAIYMRPGLTPISKIDNDFVGLKTKISGRVIDLSTHPKGHVFLKMKDDSGDVTSVPPFLKTVSKMSKKVEVRDNIKLTGKVKKY